MSSHDVEHINPYDSEREKGRQVEQMFDSIAPAYDFMNNAMSFGLHRHWRNTALTALGIGHDAEVLDVATGTGDVAFHIWRRFRPRHITGIDLSSGMLAIARRKLQQMGPEAAEAITFAEGDCLKLPFADASFDFVTVAYGVRNFESLQQGLGEMRRVLRPGGTLCIIELSTPTNPVVRLGYDIYAGHIIPAVGRLVSGDCSAYTYLPQSIAAAPQREALVEMLRRAGFTRNAYRSLTLGTVCLYTSRP